MMRMRRWEEKGTGNTVEARNKKSAINKLSNRQGFMVDAENIVEIDNDNIPACSCGWDGYVQPGASGQRCPQCGESLK